MDRRGRLGDVPEQQKRVRPGQKRVKQSESWEGQEDIGVYSAIRRLLREMGFMEEAFWYIPRGPEDAEFRKEGRYIIAPGAWDELIITAPKRLAILLTSIKFFYPEPIGRRNTVITLRQRKQVNMLKFQSKAESEEVVAETIYDTLLHYRFLIRDKEPVSFRIENTHAAANAIVDFEIIGRRGYLPQV